LSHAIIGSGVDDAFGRTVANGWGDADTGQTWIAEGGPAVDYAVASGVGYHYENEAAGATRRTLLDLGVADVDAYWTVSIPQVSAGVAAQTGLMVREDGTNANLYIFRVLFLEDGTLEARISKRVAGVETTILNPPGTQGVYSAGTKVHVRSLIIGSRLRMKVWTDGPEPDAWQLDVTDTTFTGPGRVGLRSDIPAGWTGAVPLVFSYTDLRIGYPILVDRLTFIEPAIVTIHAV
jgi:hypothetical protein